MGNIVIFGATSAVGQEVAKLMSVEGHSFFLVARDAGKLDAVARDLEVRGAKKVASSAADLNRCGEHAELVVKATEALGTIDIGLIAHGFLGDHVKSETSYPAALAVIETNFLSPVSILTELAPVLIPQGHGQIALLSSPAGDRGRATNYVYGSSKGAITIYLSGLRARLAPHGITVSTIKLGFVDSPMTAGFKKGLLWTKPERLAPLIVRAIKRKKDVIYLPRYWALIMLIFKLMPEFIFKKVKV